MLITLREIHARYAQVVLILWASYVVLVWHDRICIDDECTCSMQQRLKIKHVITIIIKRD